MRVEASSEQAGNRRRRLERPASAKDLVAVVPGHADGCYRPGSLVEVEIRRATHFRTTIREVHGPLRVSRESLEKRLVQGDDAMGLTGSIGHPSGDDDVLRVPVHPAERVAG